MGIFVVDGCLKKFTCKPILYSDLGPIIADNNVYLSLVAHTQWEMSKKLHNVVLEGVKVGSCAKAGTRRQGIPQSPESVQLWSCCSNMSWHVRGVGLSFPFPPDS